MALLAIQPDLPKTAYVFKQCSRRSRSVRHAAEQCPLCRLEAMSRALRGYPPLPPRVTGHFARGKYDGPRAVTSLGRLLHQAMEATND